MPASRRVSSERRDLGWPFSSGDGREPFRPSASSSRTGTNDGPSAPSEGRGHDRVPGSCASVVLRKAASSIAEGKSCPMPSVRMSPPHRRRGIRGTTVGPTVAGWTRDRRAYRQCNTVDGPAPRVARDFGPAHATAVTFRGCREAGFFGSLRRTGESGVPIVVVRLHDAQPGEQWRPPIGGPPLFASRGDRRSARGWGSSTSPTPPSRTSPRPADSTSTAGRAGAPRRKSRSTGPHALPPCRPPYCGSPPTRIRAPSSPTTRGPPRPRRARKPRPTSPGGCTRWCRCRRAGTRLHSSGSFIRGSRRPGRSSWNLWPRPTTLPW
ncbi:hypothetical protein ABIA38_003437 [Embleya sp. AB8]